MKFCYRFDYTVNWIGRHGTNLTTKTTVLLHVIMSKFHVVNKFILDGSKQS